MAKSIIPESIRDFLNYDPDTGVFRRKKTAGGKKQGSIAGTLRDNGYIRISFQCKFYYAHRLAWFFVYGEQPDVIDHINHDRADNRIANLRNVTQSQNCLNRKIPPAGAFWSWHPRGNGKRVRVAQAAYRNKMLYNGKSILLAHFHRIMAERADQPIGIEHLQ